MIYYDSMRHLVSDTSLEELHEFAQSVGIKRCWFDSNPAHPHYDIPKKLVRAVEKSSAVKVKPREILTALSRLRQP